MKFGDKTLTLSGTNSYT
ncbi:hypothetical protein, partial [Salmonella enterica]